ncbi:MAG: hypothetical protein GX167_00825 [Firmicutes bacterium]|nr:hypothetical protein [Bacillota bacterium]
MQDIIDGLTRPLTEEEKQPKIAKKPKGPRLLEPDTEINLRRLFIEEGWTDGLPIILPTEELVEEMLKGTDRDPQEVVGLMSVTTHQEKLEYTVEKVAVNAVMAGARPEHLPLLLAIASTGVPSCTSSTTSFASMLLVNGPIRKEIGMNCGLAALSPFNFANSVIGRAWTLMSINLGNARPGETFMASIGNNLNYNNMCCAENEEMSLFTPFHVEKGFQADESAVSFFRGWSMLGMNIGPARYMADVLERMPDFHKRKAGTFIMDPLVAKGLREEGFKDKEDVRQFLAKKTGTAPELINFIVVGGETNPLWVLTDFAHTATVSIEKWIPQNGIYRDERPFRMPVTEIACKDGTCGLPS